MYVPTHAAPISALVEELEDEEDEDLLVLKKFRSEKKTKF
jgi:hypothetical protein